MADYTLSSPPKRKRQRPVGKLEEYRNVSTLTGPSFFYSYLLNDRLIIMFGDIHVPECTPKDKNTKTIAQFLSTLAATGSTVDIFIEHIEFSKVTDSVYQKYTMEYLMHASELMSVSQNYGLGAVNRKFAECYAKVKNTHCKTAYPSTRFHNIEYRRFFRTHTYTDNLCMPSVFALPQGPGNIMKHIRATVKNSGFERLFYYILTGRLSRILELFDIMYSEAYFGVADHFTKTYTTSDLMTCQYDLVSKQINAIPVQVREKLIIFLMNEFNVHHQYFINSVKGGNVSVYLEYFLMLFPAVILDAYALARVVKSTYYPDSNVIVVYAGDDHVNRYAKFMQTVLHAKVISNTNKWVIESVYSNKGELMSFTDTPGVPVIKGCILTDSVNWIDTIDLLSERIP